MNLFSRGYKGNEDYLQTSSHKLKHFGHTARHNSLAKDIMLGPMQGKDARKARENSGQMTLESGRVSPFRTWSAWRKIEQCIGNSFMLSPALKNV